MISHICFSKTRTLLTLYVQAESLEHEDGFSENKFNALNAEISILAEKVVGFLQKQQAGIKQLKMGLNINNPQYNSDQKKERGTFA